MAENQVPRTRELSDLTREELILEIEKLRAENQTLSAGSEIAVEEACSEGINEASRFKEKYALKILESLPDMLTVISDKGTLVELVSSEETNHVGEPSSEFIGKNIRDILPDEAFHNIRANLDQVVETNTGGISNHTLCVNDQFHHYENRIFPLAENYTLCMCRDVTESVRAKDDLELANRKMRMAEEIAELSHWYFYPGTEKISAPGILPKLGGLKAGEGMFDLADFLTFVHPEDREKLVQHLRGTHDPGAYVDYRIQVGPEVRFFHSRIILSSGDGQFVEGYAQDMTYMVRGIQEMENVKYAVNNAQEEIFSCRRDGTICFANRQFLEVHDMPGGVGNTRFYDVGTTCQTLAEWEQKVREIDDSGGSLKYTARGRNPGDEMTTYDLGVYRVRDHNNEELFWFFARDITQKEVQESRIRELNYLMDAILNNIPVYLFVKDPSDGFRYRYWNKAFESYSGIPATRVLGNTDFDVFPDVKDAEKFRKDDLDLLHSGERVEFLEEYTAVSGETRIVKTSKALIPTENKLPLLIGVSWDITDLKNTEQELIAARTKAEQSDKLKSAFLANMSHEIRTPLNAIVGFSKLVATAETEQEKQQFSDIIDSNAEMLLQLIGDILDLSKIEAGTLEFTDKPFDLGELCRTLYEVHKGRVREGVKLVYEEKYPELRIVGDQNRISQVITNLLTNAIKFTGSGTIRFGFDLKDDRVHFFVSDTGAGISEEKLGSIFERFVKLNSFAQGTGLGLSICQMIVEKIGGKIGVESRLGEGSCFRFDIPYRPDGKKTEPRQEARQNGMALSGVKTIMIAEDIDSNYMLADAILGKRYSHFRAADGREAVDLFKTKRPDLILMDIKMPNMNGLDATRIIRKISPDVPIVALTAFAFDSDQRDALAAGCNDFLTKPLAFKELDRVLKKYLQ